MSEQTISKKTVRELKLNDLVVVDASTGVQQINVSTTPQYGAELARIEIDGAEHVIRAPEFRSGNEVKWQQKMDILENGRPALLIGTVDIDGEANEVRIPGGVESFDNSIAKYQTLDDVTSKLAPYALSAIVQTQLDSKLDKDEAYVKFSKYALSEDVANGLKSLSNTVENDYLKKNDAAKLYAETAALDRYALTESLIELGNQHASDVQALNKRIDNIVLQIGSGSSGSGAFTPLAGQTFDVDGNDLDTLLNVVLTALGANSGVAGLPLSGKTYEISESNVKAILTDVLTALGGDVA